MRYQIKGIEYLSLYTNLFENSKLYTIKNSRRFDTCSTSYSRDKKNDKMVTMYLQ